MKLVAKHACKHWFESFARYSAQWTGSSRAFTLAVFTIVVWAATGPFFHYSDTWQLVINTSTTIVTFLMVFLIQQQQNKDSLAIQLKLNEIIGALRGASNRLINIESLSEDEVRGLHERYERLAERIQSSTELRKVISIEEEGERRRQERGPARHGP